jgi:DNA-binding CsgD family transcriptional regulator
MNESASSDPIARGDGAGSAQAGSDGRRPQMFYIVDRELQVLASPSRGGARREPLSLPLDVAEAARRLLLLQVDPAEPLVLVLDETTILRAVPLDGNDRLQYALFIEGLERRDALHIFAERLGFTARETELTAAMLRGYSTAEISAAMGISALTVQEHVKNIGRKVGVSKRTEIVATILSAR